jgi:alpha-tubulin suppressor-like RCC1 family protein
MTGGQGATSRLLANVGVAAICLLALPLLPGCKGRFKLPADARFVAQIGLGEGFGCARMKDGSVRCWGANGAGQLGEGTHAAQPETVRVSVLPGTATLLGVGGAQGCAAAPELHCWGELSAAEPPKVAPKELAVGAHHACALTSQGDVFCWGARDGRQAGQLGGGVAEAPVVRAATAIAAGGDATCAVLRDRALVCWGRVPGRGILPVTKIEGLADVTAVGVSDTHVCAVRAWGGIACFGKDEEGELGDGAFTDRADPVDVVNLTVPARQVAVGRAHSCALLRDGTVHCWGANAAAQLSDGTFAHRASPVLVNGLFEVEEVAAAGDATCARFADGSERCWGGLSLPKTRGGTIPVPTEVRW